MIKLQLYKLKKHSINEGANDKKIVRKLAKYIAKIHSCNINHNNFEIYNAEWVIQQISKIKDIRCKNDIILALKTMSQVEAHNSLLKENKFLAWDICRSDWQKDYKSGRMGSCAWDIACVLNLANDAQFSEVFIESYLRHGRTKLALTALYANLYYVKVFGAIKINDFDNITEVTKQIIDNTTFNTDIISYEMLVKLNITGY